MDKKPLVSVIVTSKNEESNISRILTSVKNQTYRDIEIIVIDNNSTDKTKDISKKFTSKVYNFGPERSSQRNYGARNSKGRFLLFLDADMELSKQVIEDCVEKINMGKYKALVIPETTIGRGFIANVRKFEREMYEGDPSVEVARFFVREVFEEFDGYDTKLTGPEDYDLPYRISKKYKVGRISKYLYHHEENLSLLRLLKKKFYYASRGAYYAKKHPELILRQGILIFRLAYLRNWKNFLKHPILGLELVCVRLLETFAVGFGFMKAILFK